MLNAFCVSKESPLLELQHIHFPSPFLGRNILSTRCAWGRLCWKTTCGDTCRSLWYAPSSLSLLQDRASSCTVTVRPTMTVSLHWCFESLHLKAEGRWRGTKRPFTGEGGDSSPQISPRLFSPKAYFSPRQALRCRYLISFCSARLSSLDHLLFRAAFVLCCRVLSPGITSDQLQLGYPPQAE